MQWEGADRLQPFTRFYNQKKKTTASSGGTKSLSPMGPPRFWRPPLNLGAAALLAAQIKSGA
jgi:hypothetical protein